MGKAKPISLHPMSFDAAMKAIIKVTPKSAKKPKRPKQSH